MNRIIAREKEKGILFSLDFSISFLLMLVMLLVFAIFVFSFLSQRASELSDYRERKDRVLLLDSILKRTTESEQPGIALFDDSKRRALEQRIGKKPIIKENSLLEEFGLIELWIECKKTNQRIYQGESKSKECEVLSRIVFQENDKCLLHAKFCGG